MRKFIQIFVVCSIIIIGGAALLVYFTDKHVIIMNNGSVKVVDDDKIIYLNDGTILYDDNIIEKEEIKSYEKRNITHLFLDVKHRAALKWRVFETATASFIKGTGLPPNLVRIIPLVLTAMLLASFFWLRSRQTAQEISPDESDGEDKAVAVEIKEELPTRLDIVQFFLNLYKRQIGADPDAKAEFVPLKSKSSGPNHIYELRVQHLEDWVKRRMTIGPLGEEAGSKSKCYYVIYDVHMVVKVPARPVTDFEFYIQES